MVDKKDGITFLYLVYYSMESCYVGIKLSYIREWSRDKDILCCDFQVVVRGKLTVRKA